MKASKPQKLQTKDLRWKCNPSLLKFTTTKDLEPSDLIIGQERALKALELGVNLRSPGYNIYISGLTGTGKASTVKMMLESFHQKKSILFDYVYVNNFKDEDRPILLKFPAGKAREFQETFGRFISFLRERIPILLDNESFSNKHEQIVNEFNDREQEILSAFEAEIAKIGFSLGQIKVEGVLRPDIMPIINNKPIPIFQIDKLIKDEKITKDEYDTILKKYKEYQPELVQLFKKATSLNQEMQKKIAELEKSEVSHLIHGAVESIPDLFNNQGVTDYLAALKEDILSHLQIFKNLQEDQKTPAIIDPFRRYGVNILLDNSESTKCPVIIEILPSHTNLFGNIEKVVDRKGNWYSDFLNIKSGSILRACGGFLVLSVNDLLENPTAWKALKRVLTHQKLDIQDSYAYFQYAPSSMKPESIEIDTKIILIGDNYTHSILSTYEDNFKKIFKVKADFDYEIDRKDEMLIEYAKVLKKTISNENLMEFDKKAIAYLLELSARYVGRKDRLTSRFSVIADLLREANYYAKKENKDIVTADYVKMAYDESRDRHRLQESKLSRMIQNNMILIDTSGEYVGRINGLTVYQTEHFAFGKPVKITATISVGMGFIVNVEREAGLSGSSFNKGMLIINGYLQECFGQNSPLSFNANIVFEQSYGMIDGDSASAAEICVLLSALSKIPIRQGIAITGSVNQKGEIQPIGGVNEKIEGFFEICKLKGLEKNQGVIMPFQNVIDLMLNEEVIDAVKNKQFSIYPISHISEAIEILTGVKAQDFDEKGNFIPDTVYGSVEKTLKIMQDKLDQKGK